MATTVAILYYRLSSDHVKEITGLWASKNIYYWFNVFSKMYSSIRIDTFFLWGQFGPAVVIYIIAYQITRDVNCFAIQYFSMYFFHFVCQRCDCKEGMNAKKKELFIIIRKRREDRESEAVSNEINKWGRETRRRKKEWQNVEKKKTK